MKHLTRTLLHKYRFCSVFFLLAAAACCAAARANPPGVNSIHAERSRPNSRPAAVKGNTQSPAVAVKAPSASVRFLGRDDTTQGNWQKLYGRQGLRLPVQGGVVLDQLPGFHIDFVPLPGSKAANVHEDDHEGGVTLMVWDKAAASKDLRLPPAANGLTVRQALAFRGRNALALRVDASDGKPHQLAVYLLDYERKGLSVNLEAFNARGKSADTRKVSRYTQGTYMRYRFTGSILLTARSLTPGQPPMLIGAFVDPLK